MPAKGADEPPALSLMPPDAAVLTVEFMVNLLAPARSASASSPAGGS